MPLRFDLLCLLFLIGNVNAFANLLLKNSQEPDPVLWLEYTQLNQADGDKIAQWSDRSENGWHAVQEKTELQPIFKENAVGQKGGVAFENTFFELAAESVFAHVADFSVFAAIRRNPKGGVQTLFSAGKWGNSHLLGFETNRLCVQSYTGTSPPLVASQNPVPTGVDQIIEFHKEIWDIDFVVNGVKVGRRSLVYPGSPIAEGLRWIGGYPGGDFFEGNVSEFIVFNKHLKEPDQRKIRCRLADTFKIAVQGC